MLKQTPLTDKHIALGAKMADFAGYNMPISYGGIQEEHHTVREKVGVFDVSHMGEFFVRGPKALELIQLISSNDAAKLVDGQAQYSCMPNDEGGIVDDLLVYRIAEDDYMLVVNGANIDKDWNWIVSKNTMGAELQNLSDDIGLLAIQGPLASKALQSLTKVNLEEVSYYTFKIDEFAGCSNVIISATGYTGSGGFEIYFNKADAAKVWDAVFEAGAEYGIQPIGLAARDTLRLEMGFCLYGNDIDDTTSPIEAGLGWITKFTKEFNAHEIVAKVKEEGFKQKLVAFEMIDRGIPRQGYDITDAEGNTIGRVTSGTQSPSTGKAIGLGYVARGHHKSDTEIFIAVRKKSLKAQVVKLPFYKA